MGWIWLGFRLAFGFDLIWLDSGLGLIWIWLDFDLILGWIWLDSDLIGFGLISAGFGLI